MSCRPRSPRCARSARGLQQEAAQVTAELAGLEERRRGAEAAFQRIDRLHADLERRVLAIEQQRAAAEAEREQRISESAELHSAQEELAAMRGEALAQAQKLAARSAGASPAADRNRNAIEDGPRRSSTSCARIAPAAPAKWPSCNPTLSISKRSCLTEVNVEAAGAARRQRHRAADRRSSSPPKKKPAATLRQRIEQMGPVNMMALDEYKETAERHGFLETQRNDLMESIENTQETIKEIDQISRTKFDEAFARINENFAQVFSRLFQGGQAFLRLTDTENQAESGLEIVASPPGKKLQNVLLLSGGEKALTALALLVGIFQFQPSPFCVLDEVDAALDETNVGRLADLLHSLSKETQFLLVTHSKRMMQSADMIYGVTMQEPGVSKIVSVRLGGARAAARDSITKLFQHKKAPLKKWISSEASAVRDKIGGPVADAGGR